MTIAFARGLDGLAALLIFGSSVSGCRRPSQLRPVVEANMTDGVLSVRLPKRVEAQPRKIDVKVAAESRPVARG